MRIEASPIEDLAVTWASTHHCPALTWGVVRRGALVATGATGAIERTDAGGDHESPDEHTVFRIASMTKSFSAAATLLLRDEGVLRLDDPIRLHAPELGPLRSPTDDAAQITVRDLLCMTSGLVTDDAWADRHLDLTDDEFDALVADGVVFAEPTGSAFEYSNFGFALLGRVVHRATGVRLQDVISDRLLAPLDMHATTWIRPDHDRWARPKRWLDDRWVDEIETPGDGLIAPMGGLWTSVADLATWVAWLADAFPARDGGDDGPLCRASRREMQTAQRYTGMRTLRGVRLATGYGYGVRVLDEPTHGTVITHSGGLPGYGSNMRWTPGGEIGIIALANVTYAPTTELTARIHDLVHESTPLPEVRRRTSPELEAVAHRLVDLLTRWAQGRDVSSDELAELFADNVAADDPFDRRAEATKRHGAFRIEQVVPLNDARARVTCAGADATSITLTFSLAPTRPLRVQDYEIESNGTDPG